MRTGECAKVRFGVYRNASGVRVDSGRGDFNKDGELLMEKSAVSGVSGAEKSCDNCAHHVYCWDMAGANLMAREVAQHFRSYCVVNVLFMWEEDYG